MSGLVISWDTLSTTEEAGSVELDLIVSETHDLNSKATAHPVEEGPDVSDHIRPELKGISVECEVSNQPIRSIGGHEIAREDVELEAAAGDRPARSVRVLSWDGEEFDRPLEVYDQLEAIRLGRKRVDATGLRFGDIFGWVITSCSIVSKTADGATISLEFKEMRTVETQTASAPSPRVDRARRGRNRGRQKVDVPQNPDLEGVDPAVADHVNRQRPSSSTSTTTATTGGA